MERRSAVFSERVWNATGGRPQAIAGLVHGFKEGNQFQTLLGGGIRQDIYDGECYSGIAETDARYCLHQNACGTVLRRILVDF